MKHILKIACFILVAFTRGAYGQVYDSLGNKEAQEAADALYCELDISLKDALVSIPFSDIIPNYNHTGIFAGYGSEGILKTNESTGNTDTTEVKNFASSFQSKGSGYYGAYTLNNKTLDYKERRELLATAKNVIDGVVAYPSLDIRWTDIGLPALVYKGVSFDGEVSDIAELRCDALVEYVYEKNGHQSWWSTTEEANRWSIVDYPDTHNDLLDLLPNPEEEFSPWAQRGTPPESGGGAKDYTNWENARLTKKAVAAGPVITLVADASGALITASDVSGVYKIEAREEGGAYRTVGSPKIWSEMTSADRTVDDTFARPGSESFVYYVRATDTAGNVTEKSYQIPALPDLAVKILSVDDTGIPDGDFQVGQQVKVRVEVENLGEGTAAASMVGYYLAKNASAPTGEELFGYDNTGELDYLESEEDSYDYTFTRADAGSVLYFVAKADYNDEVVEGAEFSNLLHWGPFEVEETAEPTLSIAKDRLDFSCSEGVQDIGFSSFYEWTATPSAAWVGIDSPGEGNGLSTVLLESTVTVSYNDTGSDREASILFESRDLKRTLRIYQVACSVSEITFESSGYIPGSKSDVIIGLPDSGLDDSGGAGLTVVLQEGWGYVSSSVGNPSEIVEINESEIELRWAWSSLPSEKINLRLVAPEEQSGNVVVSGEIWAQSRSGTYDRRSIGDRVLAELSAYHSADLNQNWVIEFTELLAVIELYDNYDLEGKNIVSAYHCDSDDTLHGGYRAGIGDHDCLPHSSDFNPQDWRIDFMELLRLIDFFGYEDSTGVTGRYHRDASQSDGFWRGGTEE